VLDPRKKISMRILRNVQERLVKSRNVFRVHFRAKCTICILCSGFLKTTIYWVFRDISLDDGPWWNIFYVIITKLMLRWCEPLVNNSLTFLEWAESIKSCNTIWLGKFSNSGKNLTNETSLKLQGVFFSLLRPTMFSYTL